MVQLTNQALNSSVNSLLERKSTASTLALVGGKHPLGPGIVMRIILMSVHNELMPNTVMWSRQHITGIYYILGFDDPLLQSVSTETSKDHTVGSSDTGTSEHDNAKLGASIRGTTHSSNKINITKA
jgi:hypothetical protein